METGILGRYQALCIDDFEYRIKDESTGRYRNIKLKEKRVVTYNPKLARKQIHKSKEKSKKQKPYGHRRLKNQSMATVPNMILHIL